MKKFHFLLLLVMLSLAANRASAQLAVDKGSKFLNAGIGLGGYGYGGLGGYGYGYNSGVAIGASFEVGVYKNITVGGFADYRRLNFGVIGTGVNYIYFGARGSYHFNELLKLPTDKADVYAGIGLGYLSASYPDQYFAGINAGGIIVPIHIGGRYFFTDKVGGFLEFASDVAPLKLGVTLKL